MVCVLMFNKFCLDQMKKTVPSLSPSTVICERTTLHFVSLDFSLANKHQQCEHRSSLHTWPESPVQNSAISHSFTAYLQS